MSVVARSGSSVDESRRAECKQQRPTAIRSRVVIIALATGAVVYATFIGSSGARYEGELYFTLFDDAMISMTYARNFAEGHGLVWNPGGERVEGYTNFLWTVWMAAIHLVPLAASKLSLLVMLTGAVILLANIVVVAKLAEQIDLVSPLAYAYAVGSVAICWPLLFWTLRGMEVGAFCLILNLCILQASRLMELPSPRRVLCLGALFAVGLLIRPDFIVACAGICLVLAIAWRSPARRRLLLGLVLMIGATLLAQTAFRVAYYGDPLPNTYYLKVSGYSLAVRVERGLATFWQSFTDSLWPLFATAALSLAGRGVLRRPAFALAAVIVLLQCCYSIFVGGDAWETFRFANRYLTVALPALILCSAAGIDAVLARIGAGTRWLLAPALGLIAIAWIPMNGTQLARWADSGVVNVDRDHAWALKGLNIAARTPPDTTLGVMAAGAVPYFSHRRSIDLLGKSDRVVARSPPVNANVFLPGHSTWNYAYSIGELRPDLIVQIALFTHEDREFLNRMGYVEAPRSLGGFMTRELAARLE